MSDNARFALLVTGFVVYYVVMWIVLSMVWHWMIYKPKPPEKP
ncbi:MAG: hypothetical protein R3268_08935 [Acidiferrobacterales bacterium]|nr:hypothetical protein [Acidiferrobacterales bacterium]